MSRTWLTHARLLPDLFSPIRRAFLLFLLALTAVHSVSVHAASPLPLAVRQAMRQAALPPGAVAIYAQDVTRATPLLSFNADRSMNPASVMKLLTTYAGLEVLGPAYRWQTGFYADGEVKEGVLSGNLYIQGQGDPTLTLERFWLMLRHLRLTGVREIRGDLVLDRSYFAVSQSDPGAFDNQPYRAYNVLPDALLVNYKITEVKFLPDMGQGAVKLQADPLPSTMGLESRVELDKEGECGDWKEKLQIQQTNGAVPRAVISGKFAAACGEKMLELSLFEHNPYFLGLFRQFWESLGGRLAGTAHDGLVPANARPLLRFDSPSLAEVLRGINKFSNNVMARHVFLTLGAQAGLPGTAEKGEAAIKAWLAGKRLDFPELVLENGAGLSRNERISARHLGMLLSAASQSAVFAEFESSLPIVAVDGTMKKRLNDNALAGHAHIKTGSLEGVRSIAGYVLDGKGRRVAVVCLVNHPNAAAAKQVEDALLEWVYNRK